VPSIFKFKTEHVCGFDSCFEAIPKYFEYKINFLIQLNFSYNLLYNNRLSKRYLDLNQEFELLSHRGMNFVNINSELDSLGGREFYKLYSNSD